MTTALVVGALVIPSPAGAAVGSAAQPQSALASAADPSAPDAEDSPTWTDTFTRSSTGGWGDDYVSRPASDASVSEDAGAIAVRGGNRSIHVATTAEAADATVGATIRYSAVPTAGYGATTIVTTRNGDEGYYGARFRLDTQSRGVLSLARYDANDTQTVIRQDLLLLDEVPAGAAVRVEIDTTGTDDVTVRARAWLEGAAVPDWQMSVTDDSAAAVTAVGTPGIQTYMSPGNPAMTVRVDDVSVQSADLAPAPTEPTPPTPEPTEPTVPTPEPTEPTTPTVPTPEPTEPTTPTPEPTEPTVPTEPTPPTEPTTPVPPTTPTPPTTPVPPTAPEPPVTPPASGGTAGSVPVGESSYPAPAGAIYVVPDGSRATGSGSKSSPVAGAQRAIDSAPSGSTLVLREGVYRESITVPFFKKLTIQSAPGEAVWFDGSRQVTGWSQSGSTWAAPWSTFFDSRVSFSAGQDETSWWVNGSNPLAGHPDQLWIDGVPLTQVGSRAEVSAGEFFVDRGAKQIVVGSDPAGHLVEASALAKGIKIQGEGTTLRGIGVQRYATTVALLGAVSAEVDDLTLENMVIRDNATVGLFAWNDDKTLRNLTVTGNGLLGIAVNDAENLRLQNSLVTGNNSSKFNYTPVAGGVKMSRASDVTVSDSIISDNVGSTGLWFDVSSSKLTVTDNVFEGNGREGLEIELSQTATVAGNYIVGNGNSGVFVFDSGDVDIWNNTIVGNGRTITYMQDERRQEVSSLRTLIPWVTSDVIVRNNVLSYGGQACPMLVQDLTTTWYGGQFGISQDANLYHRTSASSPANFACWADGPKGTRGITTIEEFRALTGNDAKSVLVEGAPIVDPTTWQLTTANPGVGVAALPGKVAEALGVSLQTRTIGAPNAPVTAR